MTTVASTFRVPDPATSPAVRFTPLGRMAAAAMLFLGGGFQLASFAIEPQHDETIDRLRWVADHPNQAELAKLFDVLAMPFLVGIVVVYVLLSRQRSPRLAYAGGTLLACAMVGLSMVQGTETLMFALAEDGRVGLATLADVADNASTPAAIAMLIVFIPFAFFGLITLAVALWRSAAVPRGAVLLIGAFILFDFVLQMGLIGHAIAFVGDCWIAAAVILAGRQAPEAGAVAVASAG